MALLLLVMGGLSPAYRSHSYMASKPNPGPGRMGTDFIIGHRGQMIPMVGGGGPELTMSLKELNEEIAGKSKILPGVFTEAGESIDLALVKTALGDGDNTSRAEKLKAMNDELSGLGELRDKRGFLESAREKAAKMNEESNLPAKSAIHPTGSGPGEMKTFGELFVESEAYKGFKSHQGPTDEIKDLSLIQMKTVFSTGAGYEPENLRTGRVELDPQRPIAVIDHIPMLPINSDAVRFMEETTFTNNAAEVAESTATTGSDLVGESAFAFTERTHAVEWLPVFVPVTQQQMEDVEGIGAYLDLRLAYQLRARLDSQILNGDGSTPNIEGTVNVSGIGSQAKGTDPTPDAIYKAFDLIRTNGFTEPSVLFTHPTDWQAVRLLRTADGIYIWGSPTEAGPDRVWGVPVVKTTAVSQNTMVAGDYVNFAALHTKRGITIQVSDSHSHYFTRGMLAVRADMRIAMVHYRPEAFALVTGV